MPASTQNSRWAAMPFALLLLHLVVGAGGLARSGRRPPPPSQKKPSWKPQLLDAEPAPAPPRVLHRDADVVVVDKPPGWSVDAAAAFVADLLGAEPRVRQRLDADCSGVLCLGASAAGDAALRDAAPSYLALVDDEPARAAAARGACSIIESGPAGAVVRVKIHLRPSCSRSAVPRWATDVGEARELLLPHGQQMRAHPLLHVRLPPRVQRRALRAPPEHSPSQRATLGHAQSAPKL